MKEKKWNKDMTEALENASVGFFTALSKEGNLKRESIIGILVLGLAWAYKVSSIELIVLILMMSIIIALELVNTSIETVINMETTRYSNSAKYAKDVAAGAVIFVSMVSIVIGYIIFIDRFIGTLKGVIGFNTSEIAEGTMLTNGILYLSVTSIVIAVFALLFKSVRIAFSSALTTVSIFLATLFVESRIILLAIIALGFTVLVRGIKARDEGITNTKTRVITGIIFGLVLSCGMYIVMIKPEMMFKMLEMKA